jgi:hypothetical protein
MLTQDQIQAIRSPFPAEALSSDVSRGFELTSIKAAFVIERLNDVFGPCGIGWRYVHSPFEELPTGNGRTEIVAEVALQYRFPATNDRTGCDKIVWDAQTGNWAFRSSNNDWSEPIFAAGGRMAGRGSAPITDARKSAVTDGLTKAASMLGIGHHVFKGQVRVGGGNGRRRAPRKQTRDERAPTDNSKEQAPSAGDNGRDGLADSTIFWRLYHAEGKAAGVPMEAAKGLVSKGDWTVACKELRALIAAGAKS